MQKIEHIGIAVKELSVSIPLFEILLNTNCYKTEIVESENVKTAFFKRGETKIECLTQAGFKLLNTVPKVGADNKLVCFLHPKNTNGVLIELCQSIHDHD